jgi:hypothetical protein
VPVDPNISLQIAPPQQQGGVALDTISRFATIQNALNQNRLFQQTFTARQQAGQILSAAPDLDTGLSNLFKDPLTAAFAPELVNTARQMQNTMADIATKRQALAQGGLSFTLKNLSSALADPSMLEGSLQAGLSTVDPMAAPQVRAAMSSIVQSLGHGLPEGPAGVAAYRSRLTGLLLSSGFTPEALHELSGTPSIQDLGGQRVPGVTAPAWAGGGFQPATSGGLPMSPVPRVSMEPTGPGGALTPIQLGGQGGAGGVGAPGATAQGAVQAPGMTQRTYLEARGKDMADYQKSLDERVSIGTTIMQTVSEAKDALSAVKAGGGGETYAKLAQFAQAFGASNELVDKIASGSLPASQEFSKLMVNTTMGQIREQLQGVGASRLSQMEFQSFTKNNPNLETDPRAIEKIFNFWTRLYNRDALEQQELGKHLGGGEDLSGWPAKWQGIMRERGIVGVSTPVAGSQKETPSAVTHQWIPGRGLVPVSPSP